MARPNKNQHLVPDDHTCKHCGITKKEGGIFTVSFIKGIPYFRRNCSGCRLLGTNSEQFNALRETSIENRNTRREKNLKWFKGYFKHKRYT